jgi:hypothetical protein
MRQRFRAFTPALVLTLTGSVTPIAAHAETVHMRVGEPLSRFALLKNGTHRYLRYTVKADGARSAIDIWARTLSFESNRLHITQRWDEVAGKALLIQDSWFEPRTFRALTHVRHLERDGKTTIKGYQFSDAKVTGLADLDDNVNRDFSIDLPQPSYNFEYDMEFLQTLPLGSQRTFDIPFYDAGVDTPGRYLFVVSGSDKVNGPDGRSIDCWVVTADYNTGKVVSRFWFAKSGQVLIREEQFQADGTLLVKTLLPPEAADQPVRT